MALLSLDMIREIRGVAEAYATRERARLGSTVQDRDARPTPVRRPDAGAPERR